MERKNSIKKIKEIKIVNQDGSTELANIGADAVNVDHNNTNVKSKLDELDATSNLLTTAQINLQDQINELADGSPLVASSVSEMTDTSHIYVNTTDGHWYWHNGTTWLSGGVYQATQIGRNSIEATKLKLDLLKAVFLNKEVNVFDLTTIKDNGFYNNTNNGKWTSNANFMSSDFIPIISKNYIIVDGGNVCVFDSNLNFLGKDVKANGATFLTFAIDKTKYDGTTSMCLFNGYSREYLSYLNAGETLNFNSNIIKMLKQYYKNKIVNLFDKREYRTGGFYNNSSNGNWTSNASFCSTGLIPVVSETIYTNMSNHFTFWDKDLNYVGKTYSENAVYMREAFQSSADVSTLMLCFGGKPTSYINYLETINNYNFDDLDIELIKILYDGKIVNMFNPNDYKSGGFYNHNKNGNWVANTDFVSTGLIPVLNSNIYSNASKHFCFYDKNLNFLGADYTSDAVYMREAINITNINIDEVMVCFGGQPSSYIAYKESQISDTSKSKLNNIKISCVGDSMVTDGYAPWKDIFRNTYNATINDPVGGHGGDITVFSQYVSNINTNCDVIIVWAGTNDWFHNQPMGNIEDTPSYGVNVLASWKYVLEYLSTNLPSKKILAITPSPRWYRTEDTPNVNSLGENINSLGYSLRQLSNEIEKLCNLYSIPCINMMNLAGWNKNNYTIYLRDGIHQNTNGGYRVANLISNYLTDYVL